MNKLRVRDNERGQFQVQLTSTEGTITCVVSVTKEMATPERRRTALTLAKVLAGRLDGEIEVSTEAAKPLRRSTTFDMSERTPPPRQ